ncbi:MAG: site-specific tyrosine recombinase XerD [Chloroflexi bacterium]|nr:site-specific tyrosine recombinase XerD [Chloroflexota bacterium]
MKAEVENFLSHLSAERSLSPNTISAYKNDLSQLEEFVAQSSTRLGLSTSWSALDKSMLTTYLVSLKEKEYAPATVARKVAAARSFFRFLMSEGMLAKDPTQDIASPKVGKSLPRPISVSEVEALLHQPVGTSPEARRDRAMLELMYASGMRVSELVSLDMGDVNLNEGQVRCFGKGAKERIIPVHPTAAQAVAEYLNEARPRLARDSSEKGLFLNRRGARLTRQGFWLILKTCAKEAGIRSDITPHTLRHSIATHLLHSGKMNLRQLQEFLGHANIATTQVYTHLTSEHLRRVYDQSHPRA